MEFKQKWLIHFVSLWKHSIIRVGWDSSKSFRWYVEIWNWLKSFFSLIFADQRLWQWHSESVCASDGGGQTRHRQNQIFINYWMSCLLPFIFYRLFILSICLVMCMLMLRGKVCRSDGGADWLWTAPMIYHCPCPPVHNASGVLKMISHGQQHHHNFHFSFLSAVKKSLMAGIAPLRLLSDTSSLSGC